MRTAKILQGVVAFLYATTIIGSASATPHSGDQSRMATIRTLTRSATVNWIGTGDVSARTEFCITSTTGRYRFTLSMPRLFHEQNTEAQISFRFRDETGVEELRRLSSGTTVEFIGSTLDPRRSDCASGGTATVEMLIPQNVLTAQQAGDYLGQFAFTVAPI